MKKSLYPEIIEKLTDKQKLQMTEVIGELQEELNETMFFGYSRTKALVGVMLTELRLKPPRDKNDKNLPPIYEYINFNLNWLENKQELNELPQSIPVKHILIMVLLNIQQRIKYNVKLVIGQTYVNKEKSNDA